ncbi:hypothetical protein ACQY0O_000356 [Thecaphora frezii]
MVFAKHLVRVEQPWLQALVDGVNTVVDYTGILIPSLVVILAYLALRYPDRAVFSPPRDRRELHYVPGLPLVGNLFQMFRMVPEEQLEYHFAQFDKSPYGYQLSAPGLGTGSIIMVHRPEYIEYIQKTNFKNFVKGKDFRERFSDFIGVTGIFSADGYVWKSQRKMASHIFTVNQFRTWVQAVVHQDLANAVSVLDKLTADAATTTNPATIQLPDLFYRYTLSSFGRMAFGFDVKCLTADPECLKEEVGFGAAFDQVQLTISRRSITPFWWIVERFSEQGKLCKENIRKVRSYALDIVDQRLKEREAGETKGKESKDLLDLCIGLTTDRVELLTMVLNFLIAGRDTTAASLSWMFYEMFLHPEHVEEMRKEIRSIFPDEPVGSSKMLLYDQLKDLPFTTAFYNETLRLHPPVPKNAKAIVEDDIIVPQGPTAAGLPPIKVYKGEKVGWCDWAIARSTDVWGADAAEFNPHRFLETDEKGARSVKNFGQWKFHVFNGGPRLCLGMTLATYEALAFVAAVIDRFDFGWASKEQGQQAAWPLRYQLSVTHASEMYTATVVKRTGAQS